MPLIAFHPPQPLDHILNMAGPEINGIPWEPKRSNSMAVQSAQALPSEAREPLASHKLATKPGATFAAQDNLPKLPIPDLEATCRRYLEALEPLQSSREHRDTEHAVREFLRTEGPELQEKLKRYATGKSSYIEQFCKCQAEETTVAMTATIRRDSGLIVEPRVRFILEF